MKKLLFYFLFLVLCFTGFHFLEVFQEKNRSVVLLTEATRPDNLLLNARTYLRDGSQERALSNLILAIREVESIQKQADSLSKIHLQTSLDNLYEVYTKMKSQTLEADQLNQVSILTLNALNFLQIKSAEQFILNDQLGHAKVALEYGKEHITNALIFAEGEKKFHEVLIHSEMDAIIRDNSLSKDEIIQKLEHILTELEDLEVAYH